RSPGHAPGPSGSACAATGRWQWGWPGCRRGRAPRRARVPWSRVLLTGGVGCRSPCGGDARPDGAGMVLRSRAGGTAPAWRTRIVSDLCTGVKNTHGYARATGAALPVGPACARARVAGRSPAPPEDARTSCRGPTMRALTLDRAVLLAGPGLPGCAGVSRVMLAPARPPVDPAQVQLYAVPPPGSQEIAQLEASSAVGFGT